MEHAKLAPIKTNLPDIQQAWKAYKAKKIKIFPQNTLRASSIGQPCDRYHYHSIKDWEERPMHDEIRQSIFDEGLLHEKDTINQLQDMGFEIIEQQRSFQISKPKITGHIDGILVWEKQRFPFDVKSISPYEFDRIESAEDMIYSKKIYQRNYPAQLQIYLLQCGEEIGCFILKNKLTGEMKPIWMQLDYDFAEQILKRAERVYKALDNEQPPERIKNFEICSTCDFKQVCLPDIKNSCVQHIDDMELAAMLERRESLLPLSKEYQDLDEKIKTFTKSQGTGEKICGDFLIKVTEHTKKLKIPITFQEEESTYLMAKIVKLGGK